MTSIIASYFDDLEWHLLQSDAVSTYVVLRQEAALTDGKIRIRAQLIDGGLLEFFEYVVLDAKGHVVRLKYSYHWQNSDGLLRRRWDAVPHHLELPSAPHHVHLPDGRVEGIAEPSDAVTVLDQIEAQLEES